MNEFHHIPVLLQETLEILDCKPGDVVLDATIGGAGHSSEIVKLIRPGGRLIGVDRDPDAIRAALTRLAEHGDMVTVVHGNFRDLDTILERLGIDAVDKVLFDFGVSSHQLDDANRGLVTGRMMHSSTCEWTSQPDCPPRN